MATSALTVAAPAPFFQVSYSRVQDSILRILLNDVPLTWGKAPGQTNTQHTCNELIVPGENVFQIEIARCRWLVGAIKLALWRDPDVDEPIVDFVWGSVDAPVGDEAKLPRVVTIPFTVDDVTHVPAFRRADPVEFGCDGLPEQVDLVMRMQRCAELRSTDEWLDLMQLQHEELHVANHRNPGDHPSTQRPAAQEFFALDTDVRPLDRADLHFERRAEGRVAIVTRLDGSPPVDAITKEKDSLDAMQRMAPDLRLTRLGGRWQFF